MEAKDEKVLGTEAPAARFALIRAQESERRVEREPPTDEIGVHSADR
jgi:hypothetical protein